MKSLMQSKTFWVAVIQAAIAALLVFTNAFPEAGWLLIAKSVLDIGLRLATTQQIGSVVS